MDLQIISDFVDTVDLLLSEAEVNKAGGGIEIYLDTAEVRASALGMQAFYEFGSFQAKLFDGERALVRALAGRGDFGPFHMLGPHQAELLSLMNEAFGIKHDEGVSQHASHFWQDARIVAEPTSLHALTDKDLKALLASQVGNGANFFKAVEAIRGDWRWRLKEWRRKGIFEITATPINFVPHLTTDSFEKIKKRLNKVRPKRTDNNFADAIAIVMLMEKVDAFNEKGAKGILPCFYAAPHFPGVVKAVGLANRLMVTLPNQRRVSVLRRADYFVLRAIFNRSDALGANEDVLLTPDKLRLIHAEMHEILKAYNGLKDDQREGVDVPTSRAINALVKEVRELSFFDNVWLPYRAEKDAQESLRRLDATEYALSRPDVQPTLESEVRYLQQVLKTNADRFEMLRALWKAIPTSFSGQQKLLERHNENESDLMRYTGLIRFSFPPHARERIFRSISSLVSTDQQRRRDATGMVVRAYFAFTSQHRSTILDAEHAAGVLWVAKLDQYILRFLAEPRRSHFSLDLIYAASAIRLGRDLDRALHAYESLEAQRQSVTVHADRADIALGLAYLYFHWWHRYRESQNERKLMLRVLGLASPSEVIAAAVNRAREAYELLEHGSDEVKFVYVLNQRVYFMSFAMTYRVEEVKPLADRLRDDYQERDLWQYRYEDTLARYYYFRATLVTDSESKEEFLALGLERAKRAFRDAPEDPEIHTTLDKLRDELATVRGRRPEAAHAKQVTRAPRL